MAYSARYADALASLNHFSGILKAAKHTEPKNYIVATHGPALVAAVSADPSVLDSIGIYRVNCSHLDKEEDREGLAQFIRTLHPFCDVLIDLQGPKPRIYSLISELEDRLPVKLGDRFRLSYATDDSPDRFCTRDHLRVCFPQIAQAMGVGDRAVFDDGKMTATVLEVDGDERVIECTGIASGDSYTLKGRKGICVRNKPLGIDCITEYDRTCIEFARDMLGYEYADNVLASYFLSVEHIRDFVRIMREEYGYRGALGGKFETPLAVASIREILAMNELSLAMLGRGDLSVEMDERAVPNMHAIQSHFFSACREAGVESICATGFLESMMSPDGQVQDSEIHDMITSMRTDPDHLMLSAESSYGAQSRACIETETQYQRDTWAKLQSHELTFLPPEGDLRGLLYLS